MTVDEHIMNRYSISNYVPGPFHKLFDTTSSYFQSPSEMGFQSKRPPFQFNPMSMNLMNQGLEMSKLDRGFNNGHPWKSGNCNFQTGMHYFPLQQQYPSLKYFPASLPSSIELLNNYLQGPSPDMIKYIEKIREDEMAIRVKDSPEAKLCEEDLWKRFNGLTTEMVITKSGRRMFPAFKVQLSGLDPKSKYVLALEMMPCDDNRFKFHNGKWTLAGKADPESNRLVYPHCESPATGDSWMQKAVWFNKVKLTNNPTDKDPQHLVLNSMHKYVIRLYVFRVDDTSKVRFALYPEVFVFPTTEFIAVTAYQNDKITQLKIDNNPFAKGFRDNGSGRREKKRLKYQQTITSTSPDSPAENDVNDQSCLNIISLPRESQSPTKNLASLGANYNKEDAPDTSHSSQASSCSSQDNISDKVLRSSNDTGDSSQDLKRKFNGEIPCSVSPTKKKSFTTNFGRASASITYQSDEMNSCLRGPHTVHYTPRRMVPPGMGFLETANHSFESPVCSVKPPWNNWPLSKIDPSYSLNFMSKLCRMMNQNKSNQIQSTSNETFLKTFNTIWPRSSPLYGYSAEDSREKQVSCQIDHSEPRVDDAINESKLKTCDKKLASSSAFNISSLL